MKSGLLVFSMLATVLLSSFDGAQGQSREISQAEFAKIVNSMPDTLGTIPVRVTLEHKTVLFDQLQREVTQIVEYIGRDKMRRKESFREPGVPTKTKELIEIGTAYYCRIDAGRWKNSSDDCDPMFIPLMPPEDAIQNKYTLTDTVLEGRNAKLYEHFQTFQRTQKHVFEDKLWIDSDGNRLRAESRSGLEGDSQNYMTEVETYEYRPKNLTIVAPRLAGRPVR